MLLFVFAVIALAWLVFALAWKRDALAAQSARGLAPSPYDVHRVALFAAPQTPEMARLRRQHVLAGLVVTAVLTYVMTRLWTFMWVPHVAVDLALVAFAVALYLRAANGLPATFGSRPTSAVDFKASNPSKPPAGWARPRQSVLSSVPRSTVSRVDPVEDHEFWAGAHPAR